MPSEFDTPEEDQTRDRSKRVWIGTGVGFLILAVLIMALGRQKLSLSQVRAQRIFIKYGGSDPVDRSRALRLAHELRRRIGEGESFAELAREYSDDKSSVHGGDMGYSERGTFVDEIETYLWNSPIGDLGDLIETSGGFLLVVVTDRIYTETDEYEKQAVEKAKERTRQQREASKSNPES